MSEGRLIAESIIFCPGCEYLVHGEETCPNCGWRRIVTGLPGEVHWRRQLEGNIGKPYTVPTAAAGRVFLSVQSGDRLAQQTTIMAFDIDSGEDIWSHPMPPGYVNRVLITADDTLLVNVEYMQTLGGSQSNLLALNTATGAEKWRYSLPTHSMSPPAILEDTLFFTASNQTGHALALNTGQPRWQVEDLPSWTPAQPTVGQDAFFIGSRGPAITQIDAAKGASKPIIYLPDKNNWFSFPFAYQDGLLYASGWDKKLYAIDVQTRQIRWQKSLGRGITTPPIIGSHLYIGVKEETYDPRTYALYALDLTTGDFIWRFQTNRHIKAPPLLKKNTLFFGGYDKQIHAVDASSGEGQWSVDVEDRLNCVPVASGNLLAIASRHGELLSIAWREADPPPLQAPDAYRREEQWEAAGVAAVMAGEWEAAADDFARAGRLYRAAQLYEQAGQAAQAASLYLEAEQPQRAAQAYRKAGDRAGEAAALLQMQQFEAAGQIYQSLSRHVDAAAAFARAGLMTQAASSYTKAGRWDEAIDIYLALDAPREAAAVHIRAGEIDQAAALLRDYDLISEAAELLVSHQQPQTAADLLVEEGHIDDAAAIWRDVGDLTTAAKLYEEHGIWEKAADIWMEAKSLDRAAHCYEEANQLHQAAKVHAENHQIERALALYEQLKDAEQIARLAEEQGDWEKAARAYLIMEPPLPLDAARCYTHLDAWEEAAKLYQDAGRRQQAITYWKRAGKPDQAAEILIQMNQYKEAADLFEAAALYERAAEIYVGLREIDAAVRLYREAGEEERALDLVEDEQNWYLARQLAHDLNQPEREARACLELAGGAAVNKQSDLYLAAAQAFVRAAEQYEREGEKSDRAIATLWDEAATYFEQAYASDEQITRCRREANRLRRWPEVHVRITSDAELVAEEYHTLSVEVTNIGFGIARMIAIRIRSQNFEGDAQHTQNIRGIRPGDKQLLLLRVQPKKNAIGSAVPLDLTIAYVRPDGQEITRDIRGQVPVRRRDSQMMTPSSWSAQDFTPPGSTVIQVYSEGAQIFGGNKIEGDAIESGGQKGDKVEINRRRGKTQFTPEEKHIRSTSSPASCPNCGAPAPPDARYCSECGKEIHPS